MGHFFQNFLKLKKKKKKKERKKKKKPNFALLEPKFSEIFQKIGKFVQNLAQKVGLSLRS